jgi:hypothetical protein
LSSFFSSSENALIERVARENEETIEDSVYILNPYPFSFGMKLMNYMNFLTQISLVILNTIKILTLEGLLNKFNMDYMYLLPFDFSFFNIYMITHM